MAYKKIEKAMVAVLCGFFGAVAGGGALLSTGSFTAVLCGMGAGAVLAFYLTLQVMEG